ncbi:hydroxymethylbilane synthase [Gracilimonas sp. BCB1]|uniref:hydroxymethylbilane synthase n=1 Tax=Gracilimonas sp. BCB1 TaxID=3152362 RepID=UPI0032D99FA6
MKLKIGTRKSTLALWQAELVSKKLSELGVQTQLVEIESFGDKEQDIPIHKLGDKGVFTKALDDALIKGEVDLAVHSLKDVPTVLLNDLDLVSVLERGNPQDVLVKPKGEGQDVNRTIATGSIRRTAFWKNRFPEDEVVGLRGNVPTRLKKVDDSNWYGAVFAYAGLERIGYENRISEVLDWMIPAPSQGAVGVVARKDTNYREIFDKLNHEETRICVDIERAFLNELEAGCSSPVGAHAYIKGGMLNFVGAVLALDGSRRMDVEREIPVSEATAEKGHQWADLLKKDGAVELLTHRSTND